MPHQADLPGTLGAELRALRRDLPRGTGQGILRHARAAALLLSWCRRALVRTHLVTVAAALRRELGFGPQELEALRLPGDLLSLYPRWRQGDRAGFAPPPQMMTLDAAAAARPLTAVRLQAAPASGAVPMVLPLLRALDARLDPRTRIRVMLAPGPESALVRRVARAVLGPARRVRFGTASSATAFARDHAVAGRTPAGDSVLLIPRGFRPERGKEDPPLDARGTRRALGVKVRRSRLYWEGGNILYDGHRCLVGVDLLRENMGRLGLARAEVLAILEAEFGVGVAALGALTGSRFDGTQDRLSRSGQASYHIDLDVCPLGVVGDAPGSPTAMIADPDLGLSVLSAVLRDPLLRERHGLPKAIGARVLREEYERVAAERRPKLAHFRRQLERIGYRVIPLPELRVDTARRLAGLGNMDFSFANALPASHRGAPAVYFLPWGIEALDALAERQYRRAGVEPVRLSGFGPLAHGMMELAAGLHCFVGALPARRAR